MQMIQCDNCQKNCRDNICPYCGYIGGKGAFGRQWKKELWKKAWECKFCDAVIKQAKNIEAHLKTQKHKKNVQLKKLQKKDFIKFDDELKKVLNRKKKKGDVNIQKLKKEIKEDLLKGLKKEKKAVNKDNKKQFEKIIKKSEQAEQAVTIIDDIVKSEQKKEDKKKSQLKIAPPKSQLKLKDKSKQASPRKIKEKSQLKLKDKSQLKITG